MLVVSPGGTGKTTACMYPFTRQLLSWRANDPRGRAGAFVLAVKGDFRHPVRRILKDAGRGDDDLKVGLGGSWQGNSPDDPLLASYSLAYGVAALINQPFGKSREPFRQQACPNLGRWIIALFRLLPEGWVTLRDIYRGTLDAGAVREQDSRCPEVGDSACSRARHHLP